MRGALSFVGQAFLPVRCTRTDKNVCPSYYRPLRPDRQECLSYQTMANFLDTLKERIVVFDGAMGTNLQVQNLTLEDFGGLRFEGCNENLLVTRPDAVVNVHVAFLDVGCAVI